MPARAATSELAAAGRLCADQPYRAKAMRFCKGETGPRMRPAGFQEIMLCATMTLRPNPDAGTAYGCIPGPCSARIRKDTVATAHTEDRLNREERSTAACAANGTVGQSRWAER